MSDQVFNLSNLIGDQLSGQGNTFSVRDPGDLTAQVATMAAATEAEVDQAVAAAGAAQLVWANTSVAARATCLIQAAERLEAMVDHLAETLSREQGMLLRETRRDAGNGTKTLRKTAAIGPDFMAEEVWTDAQTRLSIRKQPRGVVAAIVPWNAPVGLTMGKLGPALITGNTLIVKPSPLAPVAVTLALQAIADVFPPGVVNVLNGDAAGPRLAAHSGVQKVSFTGSIATGVKVLQTAGATLKHVTLELGGNDPALILPDADARAAVAGIFRQAMARSGQVCYAVKRVYVPKAQYDAYCQAFIEAADALVVGYGRDPEATLGPVNNQAQYDYVNQLADAAQASGANVHTLGTMRAPADGTNGYYLPPRIVTDIAPDHPLVREEQFGPLLPLVPYEQESEAIAECNATHHGLAASVWSQDEARAEQCLRQIRSGVGFVNSHSRTPLGDRHMPFGGSKMSGLGRTRAEAGLMEYVEPYAVSIKAIR